MTAIPDVLYSPASPLRERLDRLHWGSLSCGSLESGLEFGPRPHVLFLNSTEAESVWSQIESHAADAPVFPIIVGDERPIALSAAPLLRLAPIMTDVAESAIVARARETLLIGGALANAISTVDRTVQPLSQNAACECVRCSIGIIALAMVRLDSSVLQLEEQLEMLRISSYALIDRIPATRLSTDDLWTLMLIVKVPWSRLQLDEMPSVAALLSKFASSTKGSRKLILAGDSSITSLVGPIATHGMTWQPTSDDPLRDQLNAVVRDDAERKALALLFKRRFAGDDIDHLVAALGRKS